MGENSIVKYEDGLLLKVTNAIAITNKLLDIVTEKENEIHRNNGPSERQIDYDFLRDAVKELKEWGFTDEELKDSFKEDGRTDEEIERIMQIQS